MARLRDTPRYRDFRSWTFSRARALSPSDRGTERFDGTHPVRGLRRASDQVLRGLQLAALRCEAAGSNAPIGAEYVEMGSLTYPRRDGFGDQRSAEGVQRPAFAVDPLHHVPQGQVELPSRRSGAAPCKVRRLRKAVDGFAKALEGAIAELHGEIEPT